MLKNYVELLLVFYKIILQLMRQQSSLQLKNGFNRQITQINPFIKLNSDGHWQIHYTLFLKIKYFIGKTKIDLFVTFDRLI